MRYINGIRQIKIVSILAIISITKYSYAYEIGDNINLFEQQEMNFKKLAKNYNDLILKEAQKMANNESKLLWTDLEIAEKFKYIDRAETMLADKKPSLSDYFLSKPMFVANSNGSSRLNINLVRYRLGGGPDKGGMPFYVLFGKAVESNTTKDTTNADITDSAGGMLNIKIADTFGQTRYDWKNDYICGDREYNPCNSSYEFGAKLLEYPTKGGGVGYSGNFFLNLAFNTYTTIWNGGIKDGSLITSIFVSGNYLTKSDFSEELGKTVPNYISANLLFKLYLRNVISISVAGPFYVNNKQVQKSVMVSFSTAS